MRHAVVVVYAPGEAGLAQGHERVTRIEIAKRLADLKGCAFAGEYDPSRRYPGPVYYVPSEPLVGVEQAQRLGIRSEHDLFGGVVPFPFVGTKVITHPLVEPEATAPEGWSREFARRVRDAVLLGFSAFTREDACRAGVRLLEHGPARIKPGRECGGRGQSVILEAAHLQAALDALDPSALRNDGLVLEQNLDRVTTYSVGRVYVADLVATYCGSQRVTPDNSGAEVYGGSELVMVRGDYNALLGLDLAEEARAAVGQARLYHAAANRHFPGLLASRCNYDVAAGFDAEGHRRLGVLEQSWRIGGASSAEIAALEAFRADPVLQVVRASSIESYGEADIPPQAIVYFRGTDERIGPITKYALVEPYDDAR
jgi:hypothetical protein